LLTNLPPTRLIHEMPSAHYDWSRVTKVLAYEALPAITGPRNFPGVMLVSGLVLGMESSLALWLL
jgi:hypothetical protein